MKSIFLTALVLTFFMLLIPLSAISKVNNNTLPTQTTIEKEPYKPNETNFKLSKIKVSSEDTTKEYAVEDYLFGVVAAEMPALYHQEAIKAQVVAAYTFACYKINTAPSDKDYISTDPNVAQAFITREQAQSNWGEKAEEYTQKINDCITAVKGQILLFDNKPIFAAYHAISSGKTNSCLDVWNNDLPYLQPCDSFGDKLANGYLSEAVFTTEELNTKLGNISKPSGEPQNYFSNINAADNGYVKSITFRGKKVSGAEISKVLGLRSSCFEVAFADNSFKFNVKGYGHGVGMSQTGADYMAKQGSSYEEILAHYYKNAVLQKN